MSLQSYDNTKAGEIQIRETKRGIELHAWNCERQRLLHIGTLVGVVCEKQVTILRLPEPSINLTQSELGALESLGAVYLRCIPADKSATYSISVENFRKFGQPYFNPQYGPQWREPLVRQAKLGVSCRVKVPAEQGLTSHSYRVLQ
jgi:hypothetical protein